MAEREIWEALEQHAAALEQQQAALRQAVPWTSCRSIGLVPQVDVLFIAKSEIRHRAFSPGAYCLGAPKAILEPQRQGVERMTRSSHGAFSQASDPSAVEAIGVRNMPSMVSRAWRRLRADLRTTGRASYGPVPSGAHEILEGDTVTGFLVAGCLTAIAQYG